MTLLFLWDINRNCNIISASFNWKINTYQALPFIFNLIWSHNLIFSNLAWDGLKYGSIKFIQQQFVCKKYLIFLHYRMSGILGKQYYLIKKRTFSGTSHHYYGRTIKWFIGMYCILWQVNSGCIDPFLHKGLV